MSFVWAEYLSVAESLCGARVSGRRAGSEARLRAGVSRAYYAVFASARNRLRDAAGVAIPTTENPHRFVAEQYQSEPDPRLAQIGIDLGRLRVARNRCDYDDEVPGLRRLAERSLARARQVLADLSRL